MTASLETLVVAAYVFACSLRIPRPGPAGKVTDAELIALAVAQAATGLCSDRQFLGTVDRLLPGYFPALPDQSQLNRRLRRHAPQITAVQLMVSELIDVRLITLERHRLGQRPPTEQAKARIRFVIESVFSNLKRQMRLEDHLAKTVGGLVQRVAQRLLALTLGIFINVQTGRPPRALAAYDGR
ncbi:MAG: hypothetical protein NVSMB25_19620 [Thermoleophilaceae bacterium]